MKARGVVLFHTTTSAVRAEKALLGAGMEVRLVPTPRRFSSDCGVALRFPWEEEGAVRERLGKAGIEVEGIRPLD